MSIIELKVPSIGESIKEVTLASWLVEDGAFVELDQPICEFDSDKATLEFPSEATGKLIRVAEENEDLAIGAVVAKIDTSVKSSEKTISAINESSTQNTVSPIRDTVISPSDTLPSSSNYATGHPAPSAAKILAESGVDANSIVGSGKDGRITKNDAETASAHSIANTEKPSIPQIETADSRVDTVLGSTREDKRVKMTRMRRTIATRLLSAKNNTAMLTTFNEVDLSNIIELRKKYQDKFLEKNGIKLGFMSLFAKACSRALIEMPDVNAMIDGNDLIYHNYTDIGIAISTPTGLVVPPVYDVQNKSLADIEKEISNLAIKARNGKLSMEEMTGGTFTITNGGVFGSLISTPILNQPQSAILGMHTIKQRPVVVDGKIEIRPMMYLAMSYDHRIIDGSSSVTFLVRVIELLEDPMRLMMGL